MDSASFKPLPRPPIKFSAGTRALVKRIRPFSMALIPMNSQRCRTSTPGVSISKMKAEISLNSRPDLEVLLPLTAITTITSATTELVHQSFSPFKSQEPSSCSVAVVFIVAGSEPALSSVRPKAETQPSANFGSHFSFCSLVPASLIGCGTPID